jgi:hypothetical protein
MEDPDIKVVTGASGEVLRPGLSAMGDATGEKPYKCDECDYVSLQLTPLKAHKIAYHTQGGRQQHRKQVLAGARMSLGASVEDLLIEHGLLPQWLSVVALARCSGVSMRWRRRYRIRAEEYVSEVRKRNLMTCPHCFSVQKVAWALRAGQAQPISPDACWWVWDLKRPLL